MTSRSLTLDRIEGDRAVLELGGETVNIPAALLPDGAREGARLLLTLDPAGTADALAEAEARLARLKARAVPGGSIDL